MADLSGWNRLWLSLLRAPILLWARPHVLPQDLSRRYAQHGRPICYVLDSNAIADLVVLERVCSAHGLPEPMQALRPPLPSSSVFFLERMAGFWSNRTDPRISASMRQLINAVSADPTLDVDLIPVSMFWGRAPDKEDSWLRLLLAESWDRVGRLRRTLSVVVNGRNLFVQFGEPLSIREVIEPAADAARAVRRVTRRLRTQLARQRAATVGPDLSHRRTIATEVLRTAAVRRAMRDEMRTRSLSRRQALELAKGHMSEIAANYSHVFIAVAARLLTWFWNKLYDGVQVHNFEQLQRVIDDNEIVYVPCHRSHIDYLLLSYVIYYRGYVVPHIAAGINLNMPLIGPALRGCGAFFMRRSFKGNALYTMVFMNYLGRIMARGHAIEYFIEGGRSRTGRLLQPKTGMLTMTLRSYLRDPRRPVVFVPVYFGYERLVEGKTYIGELSGKAKEKESVIGMLRTLPALRKRFGKVHVSFGEPLALDELLERHGVERQPRAELDDRPPWLSAVVQDLAGRIMRNINCAATVTPTNLLALALLATPKQAMLESDLERQIELYASLLRQRPYSPLISITEMDGASMIKQGERMRMLQRLKHPLGDVMRMTSEETSVLMTYFRNNVLHLLALPSLIACSFLNNRTMTTRDIQRLLWRIYPYVRDELFLRWSEAEMDAAALATLDDLANHGLLERLEGDTWRRPHTGSAEAVQLSVLAQITVQIIERYYLVIAVLIKAGSGRVSQAVLESQCQLMAQRMSLLHELNSPEFFDKALFKNFVDLLRERKVLNVNSEGRLSYGDNFSGIADDAQLVLHEQIRNSVLQATHL